MRQQQRRWLTAPVALGMMLAMWPTAPGAVSSPGSAAPTVQLLSRIGPPTAAAMDGSWLYVAQSALLTGYDLSLPGRPHLAALADTVVPGITDLAVVGGRVVAAAGDSGLHVFEPGAAQLREIGRLDIGGGAGALTVADGFAFVACSPGCGVRVARLHPDGQLSLAGSVPVAVQVLDLAVSDGYLYLALGDLGLAVFDVRDVAKPRPAASVPSGLVVEHVAVVGQDVVTSEPLGIRVLDAHNPEALVTRAVVRLNGPARELVVGGKMVYRVDVRGVRMQQVDLSAPELPALRSIRLRRTNDPRTTSSDFLPVLVAAGERGLVVIDAQADIGSVAGLWHLDPPLLATHPSEVLVERRRAGTLFSPATLASGDDHVALLHNSRDGSGLSWAAFFDLGKGRLDHVLPPITFPTATDSRFLGAAEVGAAAAGGAVVSSGSHPAGHQIMTTPAVALAGRRAYLVTTMAAGIGPLQVRVVDLSATGNPAVGRPLQLNTAGALLDLLADGERLYILEDKAPSLGSPPARIWVVDAADLTAQRLEGAFVPATTVEWSRATNLAVRDGLAVVATDAGLRVMDLSTRPAMNLPAPVEVGLLPGRMAMHHDRLYTACGTEGGELCIIALNNRRSPVVEAVLPNGGRSDTIVLPESEWTVMSMTRMWYSSPDVRVFDMNRPVNVRTSDRVSVGLAFDSLVAGAGSHFYTANRVGEVAELRIDRAVPPVPATPTQPFVTSIPSPTGTSTPSASATVTATSTPTATTYRWQLWLPWAVKAGSGALDRAAGGRQGQG
jgi:hypothetical protein